MQKGCVRILAAVTLGILGVAVADMTPEEELRLKALEEQMDYLRGKAEKKDDKNGMPLRLFYKDGLKFKSDDGNFDLSVGGRIIESGRFFTESNPNKDTFYNKETQIEMKGKIFKQFKYEFEGNFAGTTASMNNSFVEYEHEEWFGVKVGQFKQPFLYEETNSTLWRDCVEKSIATKLAPSRDIGVQISGKVMEKRIGYEVAYFNGNGKNAAAAPAGDANDDKDWAFRLTFAPWAPEKESALNKLLFWGMGTWGRQDNVAASSFSTTDTGLTFLTFPATTLNSEDRSRLGYGASYLNGRAKFMGEFVSMTQDLRRTGSSGPLGLDNENPNTRFDAWYVTFGWMLSGEDAVINSRVVPAKSFGKVGGGSGAWELIARLSGFNAEREPFYNLDKQYASAPQPTETGVGSSTSLDAWQIGLNWTPISNARVMLDYGENAYGADYIGTVGADVRKQERFVMLSTQFDF